jgi:hypothetical protein
LFRHRLMLPPLHGSFECMQRRPHPGFHRMPSQEKLPRLGFRTQVRKPEEVEGLRSSPLTLLLAPFGREEAEGNASRASRPETPSGSVRRGARSRRIPSLCAKPRADWSELSGTPGVCGQPRNTRVAQWHGSGSCWLRWLPP